jgi:hypothetical protein
MQVQAGIGAGGGVANEFLLPGSCDEMHCGKLFSGEQTLREIDGVPLHA